MDYPYIVKVVPYIIMKSHSINIFGSFRIIIHYFSTLIHDTPVVIPDHQFQIR